MAPPGGHEILSGEHATDLGLLVAVQGQEPDLLQLGDLGDRVVAGDGVGGEQGPPGEPASLVAPALHGAVVLLEHQGLGHCGVMVSHAHQRTAPQGSFLQPGVRLSAHPPWTVQHGALVALHLAG